ncbi:alpha/beta hydrolase family protein [Actinocorallia longicatena]|uniref:Poly(ethylene terephthalate) hydrolase n=1 Tax=Actinocorallia longicatena TaxID=111803 RepID=A0ABP6QLT6_9ACTN
MRRLIAMCAALLAATAFVSPARAALDSPYERGPDPTLASIQAVSGPFAVTRTVVPAGSGTGFNRGTLYYPTDTSQGTFGGVVVIPGFTEPESTMSWYGPRLASQGFVVFTLEPNTVLDFPDARADQMLAALTYLTTKSAAKDRVDPARLSVLGHSMGGGATFRVAQRKPDLKTAVAMAPWHTEFNWSNVKVPMFVFGSDNDFIAPAGSMASSFFTSITPAEKAYLLLKNQGHMAYIFENTTIAQYTITWLKRFLDDDTRYSPFLCPAPAASAVISQYKDTCPV